MSLAERLAIQEFETLASAIVLRGYYKPGGDSGASLRQIMAKSSPALYPYVADPDRVDAAALFILEWVFLFHTPLTVSDEELARVISELEGAKTDEAGTAQEGE